MSESMVDNPDKPEAHRLRSVWLYLLAAATSVGAVIVVYQLWRADLSVPFEPVGDPAIYCQWIKDMVRDGWFFASPQTGAPGITDMRDFPQAPNLHMLIIKAMSLVTRDFGVLFNMYFLLTFPMVTLTSLFVLRRFGMSWPPAFAAALLFTFLPYHILRLDHLFLAAYFMVPLMVMMLLWVYLDRPIFFRADPSSGRMRWRPLNARALAAVTLCVLAGTDGVYYAFFACALLPLCGLAAWVRTRKAHALAGAMVLVGVIAAAELANLSPYILYAARNGRNPEASVRSPAESEILGLKAVQLLLPANYHRIGPLRRITANYCADSPLVNENRSASLGAVGAAGFLFLLWRIVFARSKPPGPARSADGELLDGAAFLNMSSFLLGTVGGMGAVVAWLGFREVRGYNRISVYIGFFALMAMAILADKLWRRWRQGRGGRAMVFGLLAVVCVVGLLDQLPAGPSIYQQARAWMSGDRQTLDRIAAAQSAGLPRYREFKAMFDSDREFVGRIEAMLPPGSMVYQMPFSAYPGGPSPRRMIDYDHLKGMLHSRTLRWSYGAMRGRPMHAWHEQLAARPLEEIVPSVAMAGFVGIYVDRFGYGANPAKADYLGKVEAGLRRLLKVEPIESIDKRLIFFDMRPYLASGAATRPLAASRPASASSPAGG
ncbi:MAG: hypothetical protein ACE15C_18240 [Phycisphaerae bacterium]